MSLLSKAAVKKLSPTEVKLSTIMESFGARNACRVTMT